MAIAENPSNIYKLPISFFREISEKYLELESACKKEEIFYILKKMKK